MGGCGLGCECGGECGCGCEGECRGGCGGCGNAMVSLMLYCNSGFVESGFGRDCDVDRFVSKLQKAGVGAIACRWRPRQVWCVVSNGGEK